MKIDVSFSFRVIDGSHSLDYEKQNVYGILIREVTSMVGIESSQDSITIAEILIHCQNGAMSLVEKRKELQNFMYLGISELLWIDVLREVTND